MSKRRLPQEAYDALAALKKQARGVTISLKDKVKGRKLIAEAQAEMRKNDGWVRAIARELMSKGGVGIDNADEAWLESAFAL